ncbi:MAG: terminase large subunit [Oscillospiraceae bacterium]|nr:terminase large subunit [Oscillospiraceae bacterium]
MMIKDSRAYQYAIWASMEENHFVGRYVKRQSRLWVEIVNDEDAYAYVDPKQFRKITKILKIMVHPDLHCSMYDGLEDYALFFIYAVYCTRSLQDDSRYYQTGLLEIARKNFKTFTAAVIFIIGLLTEPQFSRFFSVAPDLKLSKELQVAINKIIKSSPALNDATIFKALRSEIRCNLTNSEYTPLAYSNDKMDGKLATIFLADECGAMDNYPIEAMRSSQITLKNKLGIIISTQYPNDDNAMIDEIDISKKTIDGLLDDRRRFSLLYEPDDEFKVGDAWKTEDLAIYQSNPVAYSNSYIFEEIKKMRQMAILYENKRENFLCKHLNIKYKGLGVEGYVEITKVQSCKTDVPDSFWAGKEVYVGLDLSQTDDNTSVAMVTYHEGTIFGRVWGFIPKDRKEEKQLKEKVDYNRLIAQGSCFECGEETIDYQFVEEFILNLNKNYGVDVRQLGFDRYNALSSIQKLESDEENPIECVEIKQHSSVLHRPTKLLREYILNGNFAYDENKMLEINFQNARCTEDTNLNKYVNKKKSAGKVDMVVSLINATFLLQVNVLDQQDSWGCQID